MFTSHLESAPHRRWAWLLICLCIGQSLMPNMVLCVEADGRLVVEPAVEGKCRDLLPAPLAEFGLGALVSAPAACDLCLDLPLASGMPDVLPRPVYTPVPLQAVPAALAHPLLQPLAATAPHAASFFSAPAPSAALLALRSTILLI